jgi:L-lysine exporter family protein LysE/ArgO
MTSAFLYGCGLGFSLLAAIGPQNVHVISHGLRRHHSLLVATICFLCDILLVGLGVLGIGKVVVNSGRLKTGVTVAGIAFLVFYAYKSFASAGSSHFHINHPAPERVTRRQILCTTLAVSLLNPNVYLDTVVLVGGASVPLSASEKIPFLAGALSASLIWFYGVTSLAYLFGTQVLKIVAWRWIERMAGGIMLILAFTMTRLLFRD